MRVPIQECVWSLTTAPRSYRQIDNIETTAKKEEKLKKNNENFAQHLFFETV